ncbi:MAG: M14 family zinc carboxypeptidase [Candidatus Hydrothermia bacterium]
MHLLLILTLLGLDPRYHTYERVVAEVESLSLIYPEITKVETIGFTTWNNFPILAMKISDYPNVREDEPSLLFVGVHHAEEVLGCELSFFIIERLLQDYGKDSLITHCINTLNLWFVPILNPDGHGIVTSGIDTTWRKNLRDNNNNGFFDLDYDGVDLNRNYSFNWYTGGNDDPSSEYYKGSAPFSENETQAVRDLSLREHFLMAIDFHSARTGQGEVVYYPWRWGGDFCVDYPFVRSVADSLASSIINDAGSGVYTSIYGVATEGNFRNWLYATLGTYAYTIEISKGCTPPGYMVDSICERVFNGIIYFINRVYGPGVVLQIVDSASLIPIAAEVRVLGHYDPSLPPRMSDSLSGTFRKILLPGTYSFEIIKEEYEPLVISDITIENAPETLLVKITGVSERSTDFGSRIKINYRVNSIEFELRENFSKGARLDILDCSGRLVKTWSKELNGVEKIVWNTELQASGIYFAVLNDGDEIFLQKIPLF